MVAKRSPPLATNVPSGGTAPQPSRDPDGVLDDKQRPDEECALSTHSHVTVATFHASGSKR
jgi:hypothetical protein